MKINLKTRVHSWQGRATLVAALLLGAWTAQACSPSTTTMSPNSAQRYFTYTGVREPLTDWHRLHGSVALETNYLYINCTGYPTYSVTYMPNLSYTGYEVDGAAVFNVGLNIGVQFRVANGTDGFGSATNVGSSGIRLEANDTENVIRMRIWYRYIAIADVSTVDQLNTIDHNWTFTNHSDGSLTYSKGSHGEQINKYVPPPPPSCWFARSPPARVALPHTTVGMLERDGSGPAQTFDWTIACNSGVPSGALVKYSAGTSSTDPKTGRMSIEPGAGVNRPGFSRQSSAV